MNNQQVAGQLMHATGEWFFTCTHEGLLHAGHQPAVDIAQLDDHPLVRAHAQALRDMLDGVTNQYTLPMVLTGTQFQQDVWAAIAAIPFGQTRTYADIARSLPGSTGNAVRAVGTACGANRLGIAIPCHRVIRSDGGLGGYGLGGLEVKKRLLEFEKRTRPKAA